MLLRRGTRDYRPVELEHECEEQRKLRACGRAASPMTEGGVPGSMFTRWSCLGLVGWLVVAGAGRYSVRDGRRGLEATSVRARAGLEATSVKAAESYTHIRY
ncbi:hypothetical protein Pmani_015740 [Petrolisthes manimaculis]|uniref:Uncharacterized protein n=1 Tax=Petrolisthes manimaculis TaxID=1843537 RepID=A0AAE1PTT7_9EUCA|nr:hypothetical protein Pmani_015740 [Petrolisthes manimaculis]